MKELLSESMTVAQIAVDYPEAIHVFNCYNIDYCCGGNVSLKSTCDRIGLDPVKLVGDISRLVSGNSSPSIRFQAWTDTLLVDYIVQNHHSYVRNAIPQIQQLLTKVVRSHGEDVTELKNIQQEFSELAEELLHHMHKEEYIVFPAIKQLDAGIHGTYPLALTIQAPVGSLVHEHESAGRLLKSIRSRSCNYTAPDFACPTFRITYKMLEEFERDLLTHVHLENNILFARVRERKMPGTPGKSESAVNADV